MAWIPGVSDSEVDADLAAEDEGVVDFSRATRPDDVLKIRLKEERALQTRGFDFCHRRKPPRNALSLSPARQTKGSFFSFFTLPPPSTTSSGSRAATKRFTTSATRLRHFFLPYFFNPRIPT